MRHLKDKRIRDYVHPWKQVQLYYQQLDKNLYESSGAIDIDAINMLILNLNNLKEHIDPNRPEIGPQGKEIILKMLEQNKFPNDAKL